MPFVRPTAAWTEGRDFFTGIPTFLYRTKENENKTKGVCALRRLLSVILMAALLCMALTGCNQEQNTKSGAGHSFSYALVGNPDTLDPQCAQNDSAKIVLCNLFEGLFVLDAAGTVQNGVASGYTVSEDGLTYTITLREDSYWYQASFGVEAEDRTALLEEPVNAMDFVYAFQRLFDPLYHSPYREQFACLENAEAILNGSQHPSMIGVYAKKTYELEIRLAYPEADLPLLLTSAAAMPCRQSYFEACKGRYGLDEESICGNGSFSMQRWLYDPYGKHNVIQLGRNPRNHTIRRVYPIDLTFYIENTQAEAEALYYAGTTDCCMTTNIPFAGQNKGTSETVYCRTLGLVAHPDSPYAHPLIRQAFSEALDLSALTAAMEGMQIAYGLLPPDAKLLNKSCRELISESGYRSWDPQQARNSFAEGLAQLGAVDLPEGKLLIPTGWLEHTVLQTLIQQWKENLGVYLSVEEVSAEEYRQRLSKGEYMLAVVAVEGETASPDAVFRSYLQQIAVAAADYESHITALQALLQQAAETERFADCIELYRQAEQMVVQNTLFLPLCYTPRYLLCRQGVEDVEYDAFRGWLRFSEAKYFD